MKFGETLQYAGLQMAATLGAGIFALPYVIYHAGWPVGFFYILFLGFLTATAHIFYFRVLKTANKRESLLGFAKTVFGQPGCVLGFLAIVCGLLLTLTAYLVLGGQFLSIIFGGGTSAWPFVFWGMVAGFLLLKRRAFVRIEIFGVVAAALIVLGIVFLSLFSAGGVRASSAVGNLFFPFGPIFFSLAGWTAVEPIYELLRGKNFRIKETPVFFLGTGFVAALYVIFVVGALKIAANITPNIVSGLSGSFWPVLFSVLGLFTLLVSYELISREVIRALRYDMRFGTSAAEALTVFSPPLLVLLGLNNFLSLLNFIGGVLLSLQYFLIVSVARKILGPRGFQTVLLVIMEVILAMAVVYELSRFVL